MRLRKLVVVAALATLALAVVPANAAGVTSCQTAATVTLTQNENLVQTNGGSGTLSGTMICEGSASGAAISFSGLFAFCSHTPTGHVGPCASPTDQDTEAVADAVSTFAPIVTHVTGNISIPLGTTTCTMTLAGHTYGPHADLGLKAWKCTNGFGQPTGAEIARGEAHAAILVNPLLDCAPGPGGAKACFNQVAFAAQLVGVDLT